MFHGLVSHLQTVIVLVDQKKRISVFPCSEARGSLFLIMSIPHSIARPWPRLQL